MELHCHGPSNGHLGVLPQLGSVPDDLQHTARSLLHILESRHRLNNKQPLPSRTQSPAIDPAWKRGKARCKKTLRCRGEERRESRVGGWEAEIALICNFLVGRDALSLGAPLDSNARWKLDWILPHPLLDFGTDGSKGLARSG